MAPGMEIQKHIALKPFNTFGIEAEAAYMAEICTLQEAVNVITDKRYRGLPLLVLGGGSNILFTKDFDGLIIRNSLRGIETLRTEGDKIFVKAAAGETWNDLVDYCVARNYGGVENLSLIPGSVGAAPIQNIGAYGAELKDVFYSLEALETATGRVRTFYHGDCRFGYRESVFKHEAKGRYVILEVTLCLDINPVLKTGYGAIESELNRMQVEPSVQSISRAVCNIRRSKLPDPALLGNAGSFFKNPSVSKEIFHSLKAEYPGIVAYQNSDGSIKLAAGWLIEQCGWKGKVAGRVGVHKDQALVIVNFGGGTGKEIYALSEEILHSVKEKFGIDLEREVNVI